MTQLIWR